MIEFLFILLIILFLLDLGVISELIEVEYRENYEQWLADGKPCKKPLRRGDEQDCSYYALANVMESWLVNTPFWIKNNRKAHRMIILHRLLAVLCIVLFFLSLGWKWLFK